MDIGTQSSIQQRVQQILDQMRKVIVGKDRALTWVLATVLSGGHILLEDIPGVGKTTMAVAFSKVLGLSYNRVQFTPDVLPSDVTGYSVLDSVTGQMRYQPGAVLCNLFLADELNRATSRTQSALLEAMEEGQVTVDGKSHVIPRPFVIIATQNPTGAAGTQLLPDSQMDRFSICMTLGYPEMEYEKAMVLNRQEGNPMDQLRPVITREELVAMQEEVSRTHIGETVVQYCVELIAATRNHGDILRGASPRATLGVIAMAKAMAQMSGRDYVTPKDIQDVFVKTVSHRILLTAKAEGRCVKPEKVLEEIMGSVAAPRLR